MSLNDPNPDMRERCLPARWRGQAASSELMETLRTMNGEAEEFV